MNDGQANWPSTFGFMAAFMDPWDAWGGPILGYQEPLDQRRVSLREERSMTIQERLMGLRARRDIGPEGEQASEWGSVVNVHDDGGIWVCWDSTPRGELQAEYFTPSQRAHELKFFPDTRGEDPVLPSFVRHPNSQRFHEILEEAGGLHDKKQADYGKGDDPFANVRSSADFGIPGWVGAMVRLNDKVKRLQKVAAGGELANESVIDSLMDIAVYALIARVLFEEEL